jgi:hypothetical protein
LYILREQSILTTPAFSRILGYVIGAAHEGRSKSNITYERSYNSLMNCLEAVLGQFLKREK